MQEPKKGGIPAGVIVIVLACCFLAGAIYLGLTRFRNPGLPGAEQSAPAAAQAAAVPVTGWILETGGLSPVSASYTADFASRNRPIEFSTGVVSVTKKGDFPYLGPFRAAGVVFSLEKTPPHQLIHLVFDLALLNSWNGSSPIWGPDILKAQVVDGQELLSATFCNCGFFSNNNEQTYPDRFPSPPDFKPYPGWTGASEHETLGEIRSFGRSNPPSGDCSSVYHMDWTFPHSGDRLDLKFTSRTKDKAMRFGFLNFHAEAISDLNQLKDDELKSNWAALIGTDAVAADTALWRLAATGNQAVDFAQRQSEAATWASTKDSFVSDRVLHLLEVVNTPEAKKLLATLQPPPAAPVDPTTHMP